MRAVPVNAVAPDPVPSSIGKYHVLRELGRGATANVYLARDPFVGREVAVKIFQHASGGAELITGKHRASFLNEASLVGKLNHPHIVGLFDAAVEPHFSYVVMEFVPGGTLAQYATMEGLLPLEKVIEVVFKVSRALEYAHRHGVIHRDIKPANILVTEPFDVKLSDFGVAILEGVTHTNINAAGSPAYMSPEQLAEKALTHQTDIYSLGVVMFQLLTGRLPFTASSHAALMYQIVNHDPPALRALRPDLPETFEAIVSRALQKDLAARYQNWIEFGRDLAGLLRHLESPREGITDTHKFHTLRNMRFFRNFREVEIWETLRFASWERINPDTRIIAEGDHGDSIYLVAEGQAEVTRAGHLLAVLGSGDLFGEMIYLGENTARSTTVRARTPVTLVKIKVQSLASSSDACQAQFNKSFMQILVRRLDESNRKLAGR